MELGNAYLAALGLPALLSAHADALADELDESVSLAVGDRDGIRFIHQATRRRAMSLSFRIGDLLPAERTAPGPLFATEWTDAAVARLARAPGGGPGGPGLSGRTAPRAPGPRRGLRTPGGAGAGGRLGAGRPVDRAGAGRGVRAGTGSARGRRPDRLRGERGEPHEPAHRRGSAGHAPPPPAGGGRGDGARAARGAGAGARSGSAGLAIWTGASKQELGREFVESLARGLTVLTAFGEGRAELTLTDVARATGLARATARRALITYEHLGLVRQSGNRGFALTPRVLSLGYPPLSRTSLAQIATPHLAELADRVHESASLAVLTPSGEEIQYTARAATSRVMSVNVTVGTRLPAYATSLGRVLLADLPPGERQLGYLHPADPAYDHGPRDPAGHPGGRPDAGIRLGRRGVGGGTAVGGGTGARPYGPGRRRA